MKPTHIGGYTGDHVVYLERTLVTLLHRMGSWKTDLYLIGGLAPRYLFPQSHHAGTTDIDLVVSLDFLAAPEAYESLERTLQTMGFEWIEAIGKPVTWRRRKAVTDAVTVIVDLLCDTEDAAPGFYASCAGERRLAALNVWGANLAALDFIEYEIQTELLDEGTTVVETVRVAGVAAYLVLKARAFRDRAEEKDAYDLIFCLLHEGPESAAVKFGALRQRAGEHSLLDDAEAILRKDFASDAMVDGFRKSGAVSYAKFQSEPGNVDADIRRQREAAGVVEAFLETLEQLSGH